MAAKRSSPRSKSSYRVETTPRHVWLAGLGVLVVARREASVAANRFLSEALAAQHRGLQLACDARDIARGVVITVGEKIESRLQRGKPVRRTNRKPAQSTRRTTGRTRGTRKSPSRKSRAGTR